MFLAPLLGLVTVALAIATEGYTRETGEGEEGEEGYGQIPGTSPQARLGQQFQAAISAPQGSWTQRHALDAAAGSAYAIRMAGGDPGEKGFAAIRASRPGYVGGTGGYISPAWGSPWRPGDPGSGERWMEEDLGGDLDESAFEDIGDQVLEDLGIA